MWQLWELKEEQLAGGKGRAVLRACRGSFLEEIQLRRQKGTQRGSRQVEGRGEREPPLAKAGRVETDSGDSVYSCV